MDKNENTSNTSGQDSSENRKRNPKRNARQKPSKKRPASLSNKKNSTTPKKRPYTKKERYAKPVYYGKKDIAFHPVDQSSTLRLANAERASNYTSIALQENLRISDKSDQFAEMLQTIHFFTQSWSPYIIYGRWVGIVSSPVNLRRGLKSAKAWQSFFDEMYRLKEEVFVLNFIDITPEVVSTQIIVFEPSLVHIIDEQIGSLTNLESKEFLNYISSGVESRNSSGMDDA